MKKLNRSTVKAKTYPIRVLQFGEGNFLRAFVDWMIHRMNREVGFNCGIAVIQPLQNGLIDLLNSQDGLYTLYMNGIKDGVSVSEHELIDCIQTGIDSYRDFDSYMALAGSPELRFIVSNTTEAGIEYVAGNKPSDRPPSSFPAKLTVFLHKRFEEFKGSKNSGLIILPCELIDRNGDNLKKCVCRYAKDWGYDERFIEWLNEACVFCNTLVDRIVPGYPKSKIPELTEQLGYDDRLIVESEQFHLWVIEAPPGVEKALPLKQCGLNVVFTDDMGPYRTRKVRILNGIHTSLVPVGYIGGFTFVHEAMEDDVLGKFVRDTIFEEIIPTLDLPESELISFTNDVIERLRNEYLEHALMSISLNSISKFKTRVLPTLLEYYRRFNRLPKRIVYAFSALLAFYSGKEMEMNIKLNDKPEIIEFFTSTWQGVNVGPAEFTELSEYILSREDYWGMDLNEVKGLKDEIAANLVSIFTRGVLPADSEVTAF